MAADIPSPPDRLYAAPDKEEFTMNKTARFVLKTVAAGLAFCAFVCLVVGSWSDVYEAIERRRACRLSKQESGDYADEELYQ